MFRGLQGSTTGNGSVFLAAGERSASEGNKLMHWILCARAAHLQAQ
jgi:hypothetical protein